MCGDQGGREPGGNGARPVARELTSYTCEARRPRVSHGGALLNVRRFPPPSSHIYELCYIGAETREEGGTCCRRALVAEGDRGAAESLAVFTPALPEAVVLEPGERWDGDPDAVLLGRGGVAAVQEGVEESPPSAVLLGRGGVAAVQEGAEESPPSAVGRSLLPSAMKGRSRGRGTRCRLPGGGRGSGRPPRKSLSAG
ncbi:hypothetical protein DPX16_16899 [Anabarilius grahami]|uniref:Uncharacterized protein n=1 Tax=Anabarilius grahami TaxID=495550 RepID=A0A3N0YN51_ANAGA|nr:hypothetical protein DPX16_16899 [Anabarilius grahami]